MRSHHLPECIHCRMPAASLVLEEMSDQPFLHGLMPQEEATRHLKS